MGLSFKSGILYQLKRIIRLVLGFIFLILGILGLFLPILQGILFLVISALLLAPDVPFIRRLLKKLRRKYPRAVRIAESISGTLDKEEDDEGNADK